MQIYLEYNNYFCIHNQYLPEICTKGRINDYLRTIHELCRFAWKNHYIQIKNLYNFEKNSQTTLGKLQAE